MRFTAFSLLIFSWLSLPAVCQNEIRDPAIQRSCDQGKTIALPDQDRPSPREAKALAGCSSEDLYYGFGHPPDFVRARKCAYLELDQKSDRIFGGKAMLMMIYANGKGVDRNLDLAVRMACEVEAAQAEVESRVAHLVGLKTENGAKEDFSICDDITSGFMDGWCTHLNERFVARDRDKRIESAISQWSSSDRQAFQALHASGNKYFHARSRNEVDLSGTSRAAFEIQEESSLHDGFVSALEQFEAGRLPQFTAEQFRAADAALNATYLAIQKKKKIDAWGTVNAAGVRRTELAWIRYRDAWVSFGRQKYPKVTEESWKTWLTLERTKMLQSFVPSK